MDDLNRLFARAEQAYLGGRFAEARADLTQVRRAAGDHPRIVHLLALVEERLGDAAAALAAFEAALKAAPGDGALLGSFARFLAGREPERALGLYERAIALAPPALDARYNRALLLQKLGRHGAALADLDAVAAARREDPKVHSARGNSLRALGRLREAGSAYDRALRVEPRRPTALVGRATIAKERGEAQAAELHRRALAVRPGDPQLILGLAEALEMEGDPAAREVLAQAVAAQPGWAEGQEALARMRWEAGEGRAATSEFERALEAAPRSLELWTAYARTLGAADLSAEAADAAARGRAATGSGDLRLMMIEAVRASEAGQVERADRLFAALPPDAPGVARMEMRHRVRCGDFARAAALGERARAEEPWDVATWAMTGLLWRLMDDPRAHWLLGQPGLVSARALPLTPADLDRIAGRLRQLHTTRAHPPGQSLRGGTQTRGLLFERDEPEIAALRRTIETAITDYWGDLPPFDPAHPLLRHREGQPRIAGSWSVRLTGGGFHIAHYHPNGVLSSACYLVVPEPRAPMEGWLEIGGPPGGLGLEIEPFQQIEPRPGLMALFPSFFFHGTRPFAEGERLTVAFDVAVSGREASR
jgi:tetratricopeptide (TPR) repeat protein